MAGNDVLYGDLPAASALTGAELVSMNQSGVTRLATAAAIAALSGTPPSTPTTPSDWKNEVDVATTANITLSGEQTIDGVLTSVSRVLVKNQTTGANNGIYVSAAGAWSRSTDADTSAEVTSGMGTLVLRGTVNGGILFSLITPDPITLGTTALTFQGIASAFPAFIGKTVSSTTYTTILTDSGKRLNCTNAAAKTITIAPQNTVNAAVNTEIEVYNAGAGLLTIAPGSGVTLNSYGGILTLPQYMVAKLKKRANPNTWDVTGLVVGDLYSTILALTPMAYWKCNETSGTTLADSSGNGYTLTLSGVAGTNYNLAFSQHIPTNSDKYLYFTGTSSKAARSGSLGFTPPITGDWTIIGFISPTATSGGNNNISLLAMGANGETEATNTQLRLYNVSTILNTFWEQGAGSNVITASSAATSISQTNMVAAIKDGTANTITFYMNGVKWGVPVSYTNEPTGGTDPLETSIGANVDGINTSTGVMSNIAIWGSKLTDEQIYGIARSAGLAM